MGENNFIRVFRATEADSVDVWNWRNDELTREMSITTDEVSWESHSVWYQNTLMNANKCLYVGVLEEGGEKVGICRFDIDLKQKGYAEVSINLNPTMRGKGYSSILLGLAISQFRIEFEMRLSAVVKKKNLSSVRCFTKCGFALEEEDSEYNYYKLD